ncbi:DUF4082 domain-containing protein [Sorangium sp. So ce385]|uniref:DUF4082 domain-containing protein n=1 Tax=Sorangium sp. So ce385 TaxID=3133308 RepID=UPI003F5C45B7
MRPSPLFSAPVVLTALALGGVALASAPGSIFTTQTPAVFANDGFYELGTRFHTLRDGNITKVRIYTNAAESGAHAVRIWGLGADAPLASHTWNIPGGTAGWKEFTLPAPVRVAANRTYTISVSTSGDHWYAATNGGFNAPIVNGDLVTEVGSGVYGTSVGQRPWMVYKNSNYFRDVVFEPEPPSTFSDDFEDGDLDGWDQSYAGFLITTDGTNKVLSYSTTDSNAKLFPEATNWQDSVVEARIKIPSWSGPGSVGFNSRYNIYELDRYTFMYKSTGELEIAVRDLDVVVSSVSKPLTLAPGTWHTFKAVTVGTTLEFYVDGVLELTTTDTTYAAGTSGVEVLRQGGAAYFDDISITAP